MNQAWYIHSVYTYLWPRAGGIEWALCFFCLTGTLSGLFMVVSQLRFIYRRGTQYFPGPDQQGSIRNIVKFFLRHKQYCQSITSRQCTRQFVV